MSEFLSFEKMISTTIIRIIYILGVIALVIGGIAGIAQGDEAVLIGLGVIIIGNLVWRVICEGWIILFSIHDLLASINENFKGGISQTIKKEESKVPLSSTEKPEKYIGLKSYSAETKYYIGKIVSIDTSNNSCIIKPDLGEEFQKPLQDVLVNMI